MKRLIFALMLLLFLLPTTGHALDKLEFGLTPQFGYTLFFGRVSDLIGPDISFGADFLYGILPWLALDLDMLYSEHQEANSENVGHVQFNHLQTSFGPRFSYYNPYAVPYATLAFGGNFFHWENRLSSGSDSFDGNGMAGYLTLGVDFYVADMVTLGLAAKGGLVASSFEFVTNKDGKESIEAYGHFSGIIRLTIIF